MLWADCVQCDVLLIFSSCSRFPPSEYWTLVTDTPAPIDSAPDLPLPFTGFSVAWINRANLKLELRQFNIKHMPCAFAGSAVCFLGGHCLSWRPFLPKMLCNPLLVLKRSSRQTDWEMSSTFRFAGFHGLSIQWLHPAQQIDRACWIP